MLYFSKLYKKNCDDKIFFKKSIFILAVFRMIQNGIKMIEKNAGFLEFSNFYCKYH
jgi:hypothetical protein